MNDPTIKIHTREINDIQPECPYCRMALDLLQKKGFGADKIENIVVDTPDKREAMLKESNNKRTYPQIFINGQHIGGFDALDLLDCTKKLDDILAGKAPDSPPPPPFTGS